MNAAPARTAPARTVSRNETETPAPAADPNAFPPGLTLLLAVLGGFAVIVAFVLYLAARMPV
jgi:hypothetical protein